MYSCVPAISRDTDQLSERHQLWIAEASPPFGIVHGDPNNPRTPQLVSELAERTSGFLVGGLTSSRAACLPESPPFFLTQPSRRLSP